MINGLLTIPISGRTARATDAPSGSVSHAPTGASQVSGGVVHSLGEFIAGSENTLAAAIITPLLTDSSAALTAATSPLVLYGPHGCGKTHLVRGLAEHWQKHNPESRVTVLSGGEFAREYLASQSQDQLDDWREEVRSVDVFILEDLGELAGKTSAQQELLHTLDALADRQTGVILTSRTLPNHGRNLLPALRSRLSAALSIPVALPSRSTRRAILEHLAAGRNLPLARRVLDGLSDGLSGGVPTLVSAIGDLELAARTAGTEASSQRVAELITRRKDLATPTLPQIARAVAKHFGLKVSQLKSPERHRSLVAGRSVTMYLARQLTDCSLGQIGDFLGGRDHTTVLHGCRKTEKLLRHDAAVRAAVAEVKRMLVSA